jgi:hypothetical protein
MRLNAFEYLVHVMCAFNGMSVVSVHSILRHVSYEFT